MLTYTFAKGSGESLYEQLYDCIKADILTGRLAAGEKLPSKRTLADHLELSVITVKNAYEQLIAEGYIYSRERSGYFVSAMDWPLSAAAAAPQKISQLPPRPTWFLDFASGSPEPDDFPFTVWSRLMRQTILEQGTRLLEPTPYNGAEELRRAIAAYLHQFRGMTVDPEQIIVGAGTEFLYNIIIQLLGREKCYAVEDPGYSKISQIYAQNGVRLVRVGLEYRGLRAVGKGRG